LNQQVRIPELIFRDSPKLCHKGEILIKSDPLPDSAVKIPEPKKRSSVDIIH